MDVVKFAYEIVALHEHNLELLAEVERLHEYKMKYERLLDESVAHGETMMGNWMKAIISDKLNIKA